MANSWIPDDSIREQFEKHAVDDMPRVQAIELAARLAIDGAVARPELADVATVLLCQKYDDPVDFEQVCKSNVQRGLFDASYLPIVKRVKEYIRHERTAIYHDYFGIKTIEKSYLLPGETPQHMWMRVAIGIHRNDVPNLVHTYDYMSRGYFTHATPTLYNACTTRAQLSSCFLLGVQNSVDGLYNTVRDCAKISKYAGGIGMHVSDVQATGGKSNGLMPYLRVLNSTARHINQGGKRLGSIAVYVEPWHADILSVLDAKKNIGNEDERARDLFYGLWVPDYFMSRVEEDQDWYLFCPTKAPMLTNATGLVAEQIYDNAVSAGAFTRKMKARELWNAIIRSQMETGGPYIMFKDACNHKSNQKNLGTIKSSNLCAEIVQYSDANQYGVCNLASIALPKFLKPKDIVHIEIAGIPNCLFCKMIQSALDSFGYLYTYTEKEAEQWQGGDTPRRTFPQVTVYDGENSWEGGCLDAIEYLRPVICHDRLRACVHIMITNLNKVIDTTMYPCIQARRSNQEHRPVGLGVQGLADVFQRMWLAFDSDEAREINREIFETIYYSSVEQSCNLAEVYGPYASFHGSPAFCGQFQMDLWGVDRSTLSLRHDCDWLENRVALYGLRNSLLVSCMPTASTAQILGNTECIEPCTTNVYTRRTLAGEFVVVNRYMQRLFQECGLWDKPWCKEGILGGRGSVQDLPIPQIFKDMFKTAWEIKQRVIVDMAADRGPFICQSQSMNLFFENPDATVLTRALFYAWNRGLKTGSYYIRSKPATNAQAVTVQETTCESCSG